jgi:hypothetical protein
VNSDFDDWMFKTVNPFEKKKDESKEESIEDIYN